MRNALSRLLLISAGLAFLTACSQNGARTQVTPAELPDIPQLEKTFPVDVAVEGRRDEPRTLFVRKQPPPELTDHEKAILAQAELVDKGVSDPLEFYVPQPMRPLAPDYFGPSVALQSVGPISTAAGAHYRSGVVGIGGGMAGRVSELGGSVAYRAAMYNQISSVTGVGPENPLRIDYIGEKRISAHGRARYRP
jgi:hypothetical protein